MLQVVPAFRPASGARVASAIASLLVALVWFAATARGQEPSPGSGAAGEAPQESDVTEIGKKLSNPVSNVWALFTEFDLNFSNGDVNRGNSEVGGAMLFQPVLPFPLYGSGDNQWKLITRPVIPIVFSTPIPTGLNQFAHEGGLADIQLPMLVSPPTRNWLLGAGVNWLFPTSTRRPWGGSSGASGRPRSSATRPRS